MFADHPKEQLANLKKLLEQNIIEFSLSVHKECQKLSDEYWAAARRKNYVTPRNFVDFMEVYLELLKQKRLECEQDIKKFQKGLEKLEKANDDVAVMKVKLTDQKQIVEKKTEVVNKMVSELTVTTNEVETLQKSAEQ